MNNTVKIWIQVAISVLTSALTVLVLVPGNQGERILEQVIAILRGLVGA